MKFFKYGKNTEKLTNEEINKQNLSLEEKKDFHEIEEEKFISVSKNELIKYKNIQKQNKSKSVLIRFSTDDLERIKLKAASEGLPYQTFIKSTLHKAIKN